MCIIVLSLCTLCLQCWCLPVKKKYLLCSIENVFMSYIGLCVKKNVKADKNQNTIFFNSYLCKFSISSNTRNVVFIKMWLHWISGCWNKSKTSKVTYCRYKYLYTCYQLVGIVKGWLQGFFFFKVTMSDHCSLDVVWERCHSYAKYFIWKIQIFIKLF